LWYSGLKPKDGQIIDAIVAGVPENRNTCDDNQWIKKGNQPQSCVSRWQYEATVSG